MTLRRVAFALLLVLVLHSLLLSKLVRRDLTPEPLPQHDARANLTTTIPAVEEATPAAPVEAAYFGNTNTHKFHNSTCRYSHCKNCTAKFKTRQEAIDAGYRPGGCCNP